MIDLSAEWDEIERKAEERRQSKLGSDKTRSLAYGNHDLIGFATEKAWSIFSGQPVDDRVLRGGDAGFDTPDGFNVKGTKYANGHLVHTVGDPWPPAGFILVYVDLVAKTAVVQGWATNSEMKRSEPTEWRSGMCHAIHNRDLRPIPQASNTDTTTPKPLI